MLAVMPPDIAIVDATSGDTVPLHCQVPLKFVEIGKLNLAVASAPPPDVGVKVTSPLTVTTLSVLLQIEVDKLNADKLLIMVDEGEYLPDENFEIFAVLVAMFDVLVFCCDKVPYLPS